VDEEVLDFPGASLVAVDSVVSVLYSRPIAEVINKKLRENIKLIRT
jgi:hypothetical protein